MRTEYYHDACASFVEYKTVSMKRILIAICMIWLLCPVIHASYDESDGVFYLQTRDGNETYTVDGSVIFKCYKSSPPSYRDCGVTFMPANPGEVIQITVQELNMASGSALLLYDTDIDNVKDKIGKSGASSGLGYNYMPGGWCDELKTGSAPGTYISKDASGAFSIGFHCTSFGSAYGFTILVQSVVPKDMEFVSAKYKASENLNRGAANALLGTLTITTDGINSPLVLNGFQLNVSGMNGTGVSGMAMYNDATMSAESKVAEASEGGAINFTGPVQLLAGNNTYYLGGSLPADFIGSIAAPYGISVTVGDERHEIAPEGNVTVDNTILMPAIPTTYTISEAAGFYDDGGAEGKIGNKFSGTVTFVPATEGHKIKVEFDKLAIFYNPSAVSVGNEDVFKFYAGRNADESNLITRLTDKAKTVKSTADDGSMTITLASKTGVPADGWEAVVSEFMPGDMTIDGATAVDIDTHGASAYDTGVVVATINVKSTNTLNPLALASLNLNVNGASSLSALKVYALGEENVISTANLVGELTGISDGNNTITLDGATLSEGSNYYAILADIATSALNGNIITVKPVSVVSGDTSIPVGEHEPTAVTISNVFSHHEGYDVREIRDTWQFVSTPDPISSSKYLLKDGECVVTFIPQEGAKCELEFSDFDIYYSSSSYGIKAKYEIYSGRTATDTNLMWRLSQSGDKPGKIRSEAADGSLTIVFNANTTSSYYAGKGWTATVTPFIDHNMTVESVDVTQSNTTAIMPGAVNQELLGLTIVTEGTLDSRKLTGVDILLKDCAEAVKKISIASIDDDGGINIVGSAEVNANENSIAVKADHTMIEGTNAYLLLVDVAESAPADMVVDASINVIHTDAGQIEVENGDPEGSRTVKYQFVMSDGDHIVTINQPIHFYDDGGDSDILSKDGLNGTVIFQPADPTKKIRVTVVNYKTAATAILDFYSGREVNDLEALGQCKQSTFPSLPMVSAADDGAMFVNVACKSYSYGTYDGWDMIVEQYTPSALSVEKLTGASVAEEETVRGATDAPLGRLTMTAKGDFDGIGIKALTANVTADNLSDVKEIKLWYTGASDGFSPLKLLASATPDADGSLSFNIAAPDTCSVLGDYYYWLTLSLAQDAETGHSISVSPVSATDTKGSAVAITSEQPFVTSVKAGYAGGTFVVGNSEKADFHTFADAVSAMGDAIEGPVTLLVEPGTYAEDINLSNIRGTSERNLITIASQSGIASDVILTGSGYSDGGYGSAKYGIININSTEYVNLNHLTIIGKKSGSVEYPYYINLVDAARHCTISNCVFEAETATSYSGLNMIYVSMSSPAANGKNPDFLTITDNTFTGGYIAVYAQGSQGYVNYDSLNGLIVRNNRFTDVGSKAVYVYQVSNATVAENTIVAGAAVTKTSYYAIDCVRMDGNSDIYGNRIINNQLVYSGGIYLRGGSHGTPQRPIRIYNNAMAITASPSTSSVGLTISSDCHDVDFSHNSINIEGTAGHAISITGSDNAFTRVALANNAVRVATTGSTASRAFNLVNSAKARAITFTTNAMFSTGELSNLGADAEAWGAATGDTTLINEEPQFISSADLHLAEPGALGGGSKIEYIDVDLDGVKRGSTPTVGAYEFAAQSTDAPALNEGYPTIDRITHCSARFTTNWNQSGTLFYAVLPEGEPAPTTETLMNSDHSDIMADTDLAVTLTNLSEQTAYNVFYVASGTNGSVSAPDSLSFITIRYIAPLDVELEAEQEDADAGDEVNISPVVTGGDAPYTYRWVDNSGNEVGNESTLCITADLPHIYTLEVTSADGQKAVATTSLKVYGTEANADFNDNLLEEESYWWGKQDDEGGSSIFFSGAFAFSNYCMPDYRAWGGFAYANCNDTGFDSLFPGQFHNVVGGGFTDDSYAVVYSYGARCNIEILKDRDGAALDHVYVTNSAYFYNSALNGDGYMSSFTDGDYHKIIFTGDDPEGQPVEFYLADFRTHPHVMVSDWQKVDLHPLGDHVKNIRVTLQSSNSFVPAYAILDNLTYGEPMSGITECETDFAASEIKEGEVYAVDGTLRLTLGESGRLFSNEELSQLNSGIYIIRYMLTDGRTVTIKQMVR